MNNPLIDPRILLNPDYNISDICQALDLEYTNSNVEMILKQILERRKSK